MSKLAVAMIACASFATSQEIVFAEPEVYHWEDSEVVAAEEFALEDQEGFEEIVLLDETVVSDLDVDPFVDEDDE